MVMVDRKVSMKESGACWEGEIHEEAMLRLRDFPCPKQHLILPDVKNYEALRKETS